MIFVEKENFNGLEFASASSYYSKIVGGSNSYDHYVSKCTGDISIKMNPHYYLSISFTINETSLCSDNMHFSMNRATVKGL